MSELAPRTPAFLEDLPDELVVMILSKAGYDDERLDTRLLLDLTTYSKKLAGCARELLFRDIDIRTWPLPRQTVQEPDRLVRLFSILRQNPGLGRKVRHLRLTVWNPDVNGSVYCENTLRKALVANEWILPSLAAYVRDLDIPEDVKMAWLEATQPNSTCWYEALVAGLLSLTPALRGLEMNAHSPALLLSTLAQLPSKPILGSLKDLRVTGMARDTTPSRYSSSFDPNASLMHIPSLQALRCRTYKAPGPAFFFGTHATTSHVTHLHLSGMIDSAALATALQNFPNLQALHLAPSYPETMGWGDLSLDLSLDLSPIIASLATHCKALTHLSIAEASLAAPVSFHTLAGLKTLEVASTYLIDADLGFPPDALLAGSKLATRLPRSLETLVFLPWITFATASPGAQTPFLEPLAYFTRILKTGLVQLPKLRRVGLEADYAYGGRVEELKKTQARFQGEVERCKLVKKFAKRGMELGVWYETARWLERFEVAIGLRQEMEMEIDEEVVVEVEEEEAGEHGLRRASMSSTESFEDEDYDDYDSEDEEDGVEGADAVWEG